MTYRIIILLSLMASAQGQAVNGTNVFRYFGSCFASACPLPEQECCTFEAGKGNRGKFCMTEQHKLHPVTKKKVYFGTYMDNEFTYWDWVCKAPTAAELAEQTRRNMESDRLQGKVPFSQDLYTEIFIYILYLSGLGWILTLPLTGILGTILISWLFGLMIWNLVEVLIYFTGDINSWLEGPLLRFIWSLLIVPLSLIFQLIPGLNLITAFLFAYWGLYAYYDYKFDPVFGERPAQFQY